MTRLAYEGYTLTAQLTQILPASIILKGIYSYTNKDYPSQGVYLNSELFDSGILRNDKQSMLKFSLSKNFSLANSFIVLSLSYLMNNNESNSYWYNYNSNQLTLNFDYQF
ncbi:MAG: DUF560 domain-containing protein [Ignavibacteriales bacterium]|nr:DUF560 domain-containing protein [Ignavibacteriales bacterium]